MGVVDINKKQSEVEVKELKSLSQVIEGLKEKYPGLVHWRIPVCNSAAPKETDFDIMCNTLVGTSINTPVIINDQVGLSRATTACVIACLFKEFQISASYEGLIETVPGINASVLKPDKYVMDQSKDALFRGEFEVVKELIGKMRDGVAAREAIEDAKKAEVALPASGKCSIPAKDLKISKPFVSYMEENAWMRELVDTGKGNLQWERDIPPAALSNLENLAKTDFKGNLGRSSTTSTRLLISCSETCPREITRREPSIGLPPRL